MTFGTSQYSNFQVCLKREDLYKNIKGTLCNHACILRQYIVLVVLWLCVTMRMKMVLSHM